MSLLSIPQISEIYRQEGQQLYGGEAVSQLEHALQCATLAEAADQPIAMIVSCLLHDIGHLLYLEDQMYPEDQVYSDHATPGTHNHAERASIRLCKLFSPAVTEPIRLHVEAKRYLCAVDPDYWQNLSDASKQSLEYQGGVFSSEAAQAFIALPYAPEAVQLRRWDDQAKVIGLQTADFAHFAQLMDVCSLAASAIE